jgi:alkanesulfonate monooxygenase SsuD/methylene tetrahydromethanopterin reductase-like flavin-dependent oxidoreductase (luciferase family)
MTQRTARRVASVGHLSRGRTGIAVGTADPFVAAGSGRSRGGGPVLTGPSAAGGTRDLALAVQKLEQTWPYDAIIADRDQRIFARGDRIRRANHDGVFPTAGPAHAAGDA